MKDKEIYEKKEALLVAAKKEFIENGYNKASLRKICNEAGVTTGALYFFFENKEDLFSAIVDKAYRGLLEIIESHFKEDHAYLDADHAGAENGLEHHELVDQIANHVYEYYDEFMLVLLKSEGSKYDNFKDRFIQIIEDEYRTMCMIYIKNHPFLSFNESMCHWMSHLSVESFVHVIEHERDKDLAKKNLYPMMSFIIDGWKRLVLGIDKK